VPPSSDKSYIDELKKSLYDRTTPDIRTKRKLRFDETPSQVKSDWEHPVTPSPTPVESDNKKSSHMSFFTKLFIVSVIFAVIAVGIGAFMFFNGANMISADNIDIVIRGPVSVSGGSPTTFDITVVNKNNIDLDAVDMSIDFPTGTTNADDSNQSLQDYHKYIGAMSAGGSVKESIEVIMYGEENLQKQINVSLSYGIKGSSSVFTKTKSYDVLINSSPISIKADLFKQITSGQEFDIKVTVTSNSDQIMRNILLKAEYPFGFIFTKSNVPAISSNSTWRIGDIPPGASRSITINGKLSGEDDDVRVFYFNVGSADSRNPSVIATEYVSIERDVTIERPFVSLGINIDTNKSTDDHVGKFGQSERVEIEWFNNLATAVSNMVLVVKLSGSAYDKMSVVANDGDFDSSANTITWNGRTNPDLGNVSAGDNGHVSFSVTPKDFGTQQNPLTNPKVVYEASISGNRPQEENVPSRIASAALRSTKIVSNTSISGRIVRSVGPFINSGPIPPKAEQATTYTVIWSIDNTVNQINNAVVSATLPAEVKWLAQVSPTNENITFDENSGLVSWNVGTVPANTRNSVGRREVAFQISLIPNITKVGQYMTLVNPATLNATDSFTNTALTSRQDFLTTRFSTDPIYKDGYEKVVN
jgi:hypothetical protein